MHFKKSNINLEYIYHNQNQGDLQMISGYSPYIPFTGKMLTTDLDGTMLIPSNEHMKINVEDRLYSETSIKKAERAVKKNNIDSVLLNTGRNFTELKEVQDILEKTTLPVSAISLEDGKRLLNKPSDMTTCEWMKTLFNSDINYLKFADDAWSKKNEAPLQAIGNFLNEKGFIHRNDNGEKMIYSKPIEEGDVGVRKVLSDEAIWTITLVPPGINFEVNTRGECDVDLEAFNRQISAEIQAMLKEEGFDIDDMATKEQTTFVNSIERLDVTKGSVSDYVRQKQGDDTKEIRAGNAYNDVSMLKTRNPKIQAVQVGDDKFLSDALSQYSNVVQVEVGELGQGINLASKRLDLVG